MNHELTSAQAKEGLVRWGSAADESLKIQLRQAGEAIRVGSRRALPWVGGAAAFAGVIYALRQLRRDKPTAKGHPHERSAPEKPGMGRGVLGLVMELAPLAAAFLLKRRQ